MQNFSTPPQYLNLSYNAFICHIYPYWKASMPFGLLKILGAHQRPEPLTSHFPAPAYLLPPSPASQIREAPKPVARRSYGTQPCTRHAMDRSGWPTTPCLSHLAGRGSQPTGTGSILSRVQDGLRHCQPCRCRAYYVGHNRLAPFWLPHLQSSQKSGQDSGLMGRGSRQKAQNDKECFKAWSVISGASTDLLVRNWATET